MQRAKAAEGLVRETGCWAGELGSQPALRWPDVPKSGQGGRSLQGRSVFWPRIPCPLSPFLLPLPPPLLSKEHSADSVIFILRAAGTRSPRGVTGVVSHLPASPASSGP